MTTVVPASASDESVQRNLAQLYAHDFAEITGWSGRFPDAIVDGCRGPRAVDRVGGRWEVRQTARNGAALAFWRRVIADYTGGAFSEEFHDSPAWRGPVQTFICP